MSLVAIIKEMFASSSKTTLNFLHAKLLDHATEHSVLPKKKKTHDLLITSIDSL